MYRRSIGCRIVLSLSLFSVGCGRGEPTSDPVGPSVPTPPKREAELRNEIPAERLDDVLATVRRGAGLMEQFEYKKAIAEFRKVRESAPGWIPGSINLAIALLNDTGEQVEAAKRQGGGSGGSENFREALALLDETLTRDPANIHARYCRGIILEYLIADDPANIVKAHEDFLFVVRHDPGDAHAWYHVGNTLYDPKSLGPDRVPTQAGGEQAKELVEYFSKSIEANPYLVSSINRVQLWHGFLGDRAKQRQLLDEMRPLHPQQNSVGAGELIESSYTGLGRYARIISPPPAVSKDVKPAPSPKLERVPSEITLRPGERWAKAADLAGKHETLGRVRERFGAAIAGLDADRDGKLDVFIAAAIVGPRGLRDALLINKGEGRFEESATAYGLPEDRASIGVAVADFDSDRLVDLFLTGVADNRLFRNVGKRFEDVTAKAGIQPSKALSLSARWLDLDQDGDLDLYVINHTSAEHAARAFSKDAVPGIGNLAYRNDGTPPKVGNRAEGANAPAGAATDDLPSTGGLTLVFSAWGSAPALAAGDTPHTAVAFLDVDDDRDLDLIAVSDGGARLLILNDRMGRFRSMPLNGLGSEPISGLLVADFDKDGRPDLFATRPGARVAAWRNETTRSGSQVKPKWTSIPADSRDWRSALVGDFDLDSNVDVLGLPPRSESATILVARNESERFLNLPIDLGAGQGGAPEGFLFANVVGDELPDLLVHRDGQGPSVSRNLGNGHNWLSVGLGGRWHPTPNRMRTNSEGIGAELFIETKSVRARYHHSTTEAGLSQSSGPFVVGLGTADQATLVHVTWPDGLLQCELEKNVNQHIDIAEYNRKTGSCPVLFTWNGERFVCLGDFLGGGGLGYLVAPGVYSQPDRDESIGITSDQLKAVRGKYHVSITEPMDEVAYLDRLVLEVIDRPPGVSTTPDERFAPEGPRPTGEVVAWRTAIEPIKATDHKGKDVTALIRAWDRSTVDDFGRVTGWTGYAEDHALILDFGDRLAKFGPEERLVLCLAGWVEYPYSQTNYAAATAGTTLKPPVLERLDRDGNWRVIDPHPGYPAGMPRMMTVDLSGKTAGERCVLRLSTNMECYWDQAFVAVAVPEPRLRTTKLDVSKAVLRHRGYTREVSPDGRQPLIYDYDYVDPAPLARLTGRLTKYGDVTPLLNRDDDRLCLIGPGDEAIVEFSAEGVPPLEPGWTRAFVLRTVGYCKDADPFSALSDTIEPLPWKGMPEFPFGPDVARPRDAGYLDYLREYQTRTVGGAASDEPKR